MTIFLALIHKIKNNSSFNPGILYAGTLFLDFLIIIGIFIN